MKVQDLFILYYKDVFRMIIEYRDKGNFFIQECRYENYDNFLKYDSFKDKTIVRWFISKSGSDVKIIILIEEE